MRNNGAQPSAVAELMRPELEAKEWGVAGEFTAPRPVIHTLQQPQWRPPPPDWEAERLEREQREREQQRIEREQLTAELLAEISDDASEPEPIPKRRGWKRRETQP